MIAPRSTAGLAALVTVVVVLASLGLASAVGGAGGSLARSSIAPPLLPSQALSSTVSPGSGADTPPASGPSAPPSSLNPPAAPLNRDLTNGGNRSSPFTSQILNTLSTEGIPLHDINLPLLLNGSSPGLTNGHVNVPYASSPAPYGINDPGLRNVSGVISPYTLSTSSVEANFSTDYLAGYTPDLSGPDEWGIQLNAVLNNVTLFGTPGYQFWTQQSIDYSPSLKAVEFVSNIWNFSNSHLTLSCNFLYESNGHNECPEFYYGVTGYIPATEPFSVQLYLNSTLVGGRDAVYFNYSLTSGLGTSSSNFDYAIFNSTAAGGNPASTTAPMYVANGLAYNPAGLPDDFEVILGGPGGGSNFDVLESDQTYMSLQYYNATDSEYLTVPSAYNVGGETGETSVGVNAAWSQFGKTGAFPAVCVECAALSNGPSFEYGLWNVGGAGVNGYSPPPETDWIAQSDIGAILTPQSAFVFIAEGAVFTSWTGTNWSLFQWDPDLSPLVYYTNMPIGEYTIVAVASEYEAEYTTEDVTSNGAYFYPTMTLSPDKTAGVYTPLWAFNATALAGITSGKDADGNSILDSNEYGEIGQMPVTSEMGLAGDAAYFPWFGLFNDFGYQVFPGILLSGVSDADVFSAPSFSVRAPGLPSYDPAVLAHFGWPETNSLQMLFWGDEDIKLESSTLAGWFPAVADLEGPSQSFASVVFWNTSFADIAGNTFDVGGMGLFLYGGSVNYIWNNTFVQGAAPAGELNPGATAAAYWGSIGLVDADWGDAELFGASGWELCNTCDVIYNNAFETIVTATSLYYDPYTGELPTDNPTDGYWGEFSEAWNIAYTPGVTNIIGGNYLGGNYYWDYGYAENPYGRLPDLELDYLPFDEFQVFPAFISGPDGVGGDYYPLVNVVLHQITFREEGLPAGVGWYVEMYVPPVYNFQGYDAENSTTAPHETNLSETAGTWYYYPFSDDKYYSAATPDATVTLGSSNVVVTIVFEAAFVLTVEETGLPSGTAWFGETYNPSVYYDSSPDSTGTEANVSGLIAGTYTWWAEAVDGTYEAVPSEATITVSANATVAVSFVPVYSLDINEVGLPAGTLWTFTATSTAGYTYAWASTGEWINLSAPDVTYSWTASSAGYVAAPLNGTLTLSSNGALTVTFRAGAALTFAETGLPSGAAWSVTLTQGTTVTTLGGTGDSIVFETVVGAYTFTVSASGYVASPGTGSGTLSGATSVAVAFSPATGTLAGTVTPSGATLWVDGSKVALGAGGTYSLTLPIGVHAVEVAEPGFVTYYNNATVSLGATTTLNIDLTAISTPSSGASGISSLGWALIALLAALAAVFFVTTLLLSRRRRPPPPVAAYQAPPAVSSPVAETSAAPLEPWQETPPGSG